MYETVLVTGGAGFIGSWTCEFLLSRGYKVVVFDDFSSGKIENLKKVLDKIIVVRGSVCNRELVEKTIKEQNIDAIIHLAAVVSVDEVTVNPERGYRVNVFGTFNLLEASRRLDIKRFVYASSAAVYGDPINLPINEDHPLRPKNIYGATKLAGEALVNSYYYNYGLSTVSLRYFNVYGPRMKAGPYAGVVYKFIMQALNNKPLTIYGDGNQTRDFIYVTDVAQANIKALEKNVNGTYNIGTGKPIKIRKLAETILEILNKKKHPITYMPLRKGDIRHSYADIRKAQKELQWTPRTDLIRGLKETIKYVTK